VAAPVLAALLDFTDSTMNHRAALEPEGPSAEWRKALLTFFLALRLLILLAIVGGIVSWLVKAWPWFNRNTLTGDSYLLLALYGIFLYCVATSRWSAEPMKEAGFGSILNLQFCRTPAAVMKRLRDWTQDASDDEAAHHRLTPVAHTIWRDILGYIPTFAVSLFLTTLLALWLLAGQGLTAWRDNPEDGTLLLWQLLRPAALLVLLWVVFDYVEDVLHLRYLHRFPAAPRSGLVAGAFIATCLKTFFYTVALLLTLYAWLRLLSIELPRAVWSESSFVLALVVLGPLLLIALAVLSFWKRPRAPHTSAAAPPNKSEQLPTA
jgi:hypothetical protein